MTTVWSLAALWFGLALFASLGSIYLRVSTALAEIIVGIGAGSLNLLLGANVLGADEPWIKFLAGAGAIMLTFLAGAELDPVVFRQRWNEATAVGIASFLLPFLGCAAAAYWLLGWGVAATWLA
jgi:Kef-type K+ transport system membrane component KefB